MNEDLRRAVEALEAGAADLRDLSRRSAAQVRARLQRTVEEVLANLEAEEKRADQPADIMGNLERQSREIAEDLRRAEELMKRRMAGD